MEKAHLIVEKLAVMAIFALFLADWIPSPGLGLTVARIDPKLVGGKKNNLIKHSNLTK